MRHRLRYCIFACLLFCLHKCVLCWARDFFVCCYCYSDRDSDMLLSRFVLFGLAHGSFIQFFGIEYPIFLLSSVDFKSLSPNAYKLFTSVHTDPNNICINVLVCNSSLHHFFGQFLLTFLFRSVDSRQSPITFFPSLCFSRSITLFRYRLWLREYISTSMLSFNCNLCTFCLLTKKNRYQHTYKRVPATRGVWAIGNVCCWRW